MRTLIVEDDPSFAAGVMAFLQSEGFAVDVAPTLANARIRLRAERYGLVVLDMGLPDGSGATLLTWLRGAAPDSLATASSTPVLILSARADIDDVVAGLDAGSDDYVVKPVDQRALAARIRSLLRRAEGRSSAEIVIGELVLDCTRRQATLAGLSLDLSAREWAVLRALAANPGAVLSKADLEAALYSDGNAVESNAIEVHIHHLRRKIGEKTIRTLRGAGYALRV
ncbi:MAG: response regulator transcription factor [Burkholderiales bacterium]|nr:response regulator transcription factor [Burkholderiales bacterium]